VFAGGNFAEADSPHDHYELLLERGVPAVLVNAAAEHLRYPRVCVDDAAAVEQALGHLLSLGHRRVGLIIGPDDHMPSRRKLAAFTALAARAGIATADAVEHTMFSVEAGHASAARLVRAGITGIVCGNDPLALGAILGKHEEGEVRQALDTVPEKKAEGMISRLLGPTLVWLRHQLFGAATRL